ncbi:MAG: FG-GAP-like repeat-containing protein [Gammaproteobacteria bacterium]|nr:FG-GAP-like repeat-containing protein [Gammaproteobacteria bacterium]
MARKRLTKVISSNGNEIFRTYRIAYQRSDEVDKDKISRLDSITECRNNTDHCLRPTKFKWSVADKVKFGIDAIQPFADSPAVGRANSTIYMGDDWRDSAILEAHHPTPADINGDGRMDIVFLRYDTDNGSGVNARLKYLINLDNGNYSEVRAAVFNEDLVYPELLLTPARSRLALHVVDYNADGRDDIIIRQFNPLATNAEVAQADQWRLVLSIPDALRGGWRLQNVTSHQFSFENNVLTSNQLHSEKLFFADMNNDGLADAVSGNYYWLLERRVGVSSSSDMAYKFSDRKSISFLLSTTETQILRDTGNSLEYREVNRYAPIGDSGRLITYNCITRSRKTHAHSGDINGDGIADFIATINIRCSPTVQSNPSANPYIGSYSSYSNPPTKNKTIYLIYESRASRRTINGVSTEVLSYSPYPGSSHVFLNRTWPGRSDYVAANHITYGDINADGLTDLVMFDPGIHSFRFLISTGGGFQNSYIIELAPASVEDITRYRIRLVDLNRDQMLDLVWRKGNEMKVKYWGVYAFATPNQTGYTFGPAHTVKSVANQSSRSHSHFFYDSNGDGFTDYIHFQQNVNTTSSIVKIYNAESFNAVANRRLHGRVYLVGSAHPQNQHNYLHPLATSTEITYESLAIGSHYQRLEERLKSSSSSPSGSNFKQQFYNNINDPFSHQENFSSQQALFPNLMSPIFEYTGSSYVVTGVNSSSPSHSNAGGRVNVLYRYSEAKVQAGGRGNLGFKSIITLDLQTDVETTTVYRQDWPFIGTVSSTTVRYIDSKTDTSPILSKAVSYSGVTRCLNRSQIASCLNAMKRVALEMGCSALGAIQPLVHRTEENSYTLPARRGEQGSKMSRVVTSTSNDSSGNAIMINVKTYSFGNGGNSQALMKEQATTNTYQTTEQDKFLGRLFESHVLTSIYHGSKILTKSRKVRPTYYTTRDHRQNLLSTEIIQPRAGRQRRLVIRHYYDFAGNKSHTVSEGWDGQGYISRSSPQNHYDSDGRYLLKITQGYTNGSGDHRVALIRSRDSIFGLETLSADADGVVTNRYYDDMGRLYFSSNSAGQWVFQDSKHYSIQNEFNVVCPALLTNKISFRKDAGGGESVQCLDSLNRIVRTATRSFDGNWVYTNSEFDRIGRTVFIGEPSFASDSSIGTRTSYDILGRPIRIASTRTSSPNITEISRSWNERGGVTATIVNTVGAETQSRTTIEKKNALGQIYATVDEGNSATSYLYDADNNLVTLTDSQGNETKMIYDALGRKKSMQDPNLGEWRYTYNAFGEMVSQTDAKKQKIVMIYDQLGRMIRRLDYPAAPQSPSSSSVQPMPSQTTHWKYDRASVDGWTEDSTNSALNTTSLICTGIKAGVGNRTKHLVTDFGKLIRVSITSNGLEKYSRTYGYDLFGRRYLTETRIDGLDGVFTDRLTFDHYGRPFQSFDASCGQKNNGIRGTQTHYNSHGYAEKITSVRRYSTSGHSLYQGTGAVSARGRITRLELGSGVTTLRTHSPHTGLPLTVVTSSAGHTNGNIQKLNYSWDGRNNLLNRRETFGDLNVLESFTYDSLNRLTKSAVGDASMTMAYDPLGNIISRTVSGQVPVTYSYGTGNVDDGGSFSPSRPHAVRTVGQRRYRYDANGSLVFGSHPSAGTHIINYNEAGRPYNIVKAPWNIQFAYGPNRERYVRFDRVSNSGRKIKSTWQLGSVEIVHYHSSGKWQYRRRLGFAVQTITYSPQSLAAPSVTMDYLHTDHLGSIDAVTDSRGRIIRRLSYDSWGVRRNSGNWREWSATQLTNFTEGRLRGADIRASITELGFTGQEMIDSAGLVHMNGRLYEPESGRFVQADPVVSNPSDSQMLNRYSYVRNNPLNAVDPSGFSGLGLGAGTRASGASASFVFGVRLFQGVDANDNSDQIGSTNPNNNAAGIAQSRTTQASTINSSLGSGFGVTLTRGPGGKLLSLAGDGAVPGAIGGIQHDVINGTFGFSFISSMVAGNTSQRIDDLGSGMSDSSISYSLTAMPTAAETTDGKSVNITTVVSGVLVGGVTLGSTLLFFGGPQLVISGALAGGLILGTYGTNSSFLSYADPMNDYMQFLLGGGANQTHAFDLLGTSPDLSRFDSNLATLARRLRPESGTISININSGRFENSNAIGWTPIQENTSYLAYLSYGTFTYHVSGNLQVNNEEWVFSGRIGAADRYDFNTHESNSIRTLFRNVAVSIGAIGYEFGGTDYNIDFTGGPKIHREGRF